MHFIKVIGRIEGSRSTNHDNRVYWRAINVDDIVGYHAIGKSLRLDERNNHVYEDGDVVSVPWTLLRLRSTTDISVSGYSNELEEQVHGHDLEIQCSVAELEAAIEAACECTVTVAKDKPKVLRVEGGRKHVRRQGVRCYP